MQLNLTFKLNEPLCIPLNYNYPLQSVVYRKLQEVSESNFWHDEGFLNNNLFKAFVFGSLKGDYKIVSKHMLFSSTLSFEVRSHCFEFCDALQRSFELRPSIKLFDTTLPLQSLVVTNTHINSNNVIAQTNSPVSIHKTCEDGKTLYYSPPMAEFSEGLHSNFLNKYQAITGALPLQLTITPLGEHKKIVTTYKKIWITAYKGKYLLEGDNKAIEFIYNTGLGAKNSQGFGMLDIIK